MAYSRVLTLSGVGIAAIIFIMLYTMQVSNYSQAGSSEGRDTGQILINLISQDGSFLPGGEFIIEPNPLTGNKSLNIKDNSAADSNRESKGSIIISGALPGNYTISQSASPEQYRIDRLSKIVEVNDGTTSVANFSNALNSTENNSSAIKNIIYSAKFVCGSISGDEGPLRPGHYDTDMSIFNKQQFPIKIIWNARINDGLQSSSIIRTLESETSTRIVCKDLYSILNADPKQGFIDGFVSIRIETGSSVIGAFPDNQGSTVLRNLSSDDKDLLDVQVFYTANALEELPKQVIVDKVSFVVLNDPSGKVPSTLLNKQLEISLKPGLQDIYNQDERIRDTIASRYNLTSDEKTRLDVQIKDSQIGVGTMIDDHAISLFPVKPYVTG